MATKKRDAGGGGHKVFMAAGIVLSIAVVAWWLLTPSGAPQLRADADVFNTVDALYTAVRMRDPAKLSQCEGRLKSYQQAGKLPEDAATHLAGIVDQARAENWESATENLYDFMLDQRREELSE